jgi:hypothetical protein
VDQSRSFNERTVLYNPGLIASCEELIADSAGNPKNLRENKISSRKSRFPAEFEIFRWKIKNSAGKSENLLEMNFSSGKNKTSAGKIKNLREI